MPVAQTDNLAEGLDELTLTNLVAMGGGDGMTLGDNSNELPAITSTDDLDQQKPVVPTSRPAKPLVGIIYPPPEVRSKCKKL